MALVCPQHSWPHMIEVAPCIWLYGRTSKFFQLHGLLLFCIIMGLHSAISTEIYINSLFWSAGYCSWGRQWQTQIITKVRVFTKDRVSTSRQPSISILPFYALPCLAPPAPPIYQPVPHLLQEWIQDWIHKNISYCLQPKSSACLILFLLSIYCSSPHPPTQKNNSFFSI